MKMRPFHYALLYILWLSLLPFCTTAFAQPGPYLDQLLEKARSQDLSGQRGWHVLLHYKKEILGGYRSRISDPHFFLSPSGRTDPEAELQATLASFFQPEAPDGEHPSCRFPARLHWLAAELGIDRSLLPTATCTQQDELARMVDARSAALVFPVGHINSPASMFGHTLLRIDGSSRSNLISFAANYAADITDKNGLIYAYKGITGGYKGYYSLLPYYLKVKEYGDLEHRDMWEYRLKLSREEVDRMLLHILELERISSEYYFLDENCAFNLLYLIEAARPSLHLTDQTGVLVLPTDSIEIAREAGILEEASYRPSRGTRIARLASGMDDGGRQQALELAHGRSEPSSQRQNAETDRQRRRRLDLAAEVVQLRFARKELEQDAYSKLYLGILAQRSRLGADDEAGDVAKPPPAPDSGHRTSKVGAGGGVRRDRWFGELHLLPGFHGLLDPDQGYLRGAQIKYGETSVRYSPADEQLWLKTLHLLDIVSISPRDSFFRPYSWKVATGWDTETMENGEDSLFYRLNTGGGFSVHSRRDGILYLLAELDLNLGKRFCGRFSGGPGLTVGALEQVTGRWKVLLQGQYFPYLLGDERVVLKATLGNNIRISRNCSIDLSCAFSRTGGHDTADLSGLLNFYF